MSNDRVKRKDLWARLNNVKQSDWIKAGNILGLNVTKSNSGTSHTHVIRDPKNENLDDIKGVIAVLQINLYKQANRGIFNALRDFGVPEDKIWRALKMLK